MALIELLGALPRGLEGISERIPHGSGDPFAVGETQNVGQALDVVAIDVGSRLPERVE